jgi:hypothetical protein
MYLQNKYSQCYYNIIDRAKSRDLPNEIYTESHHIIPKSLGGSNDQPNLVKLTAREHFICHLLLPKMLTGIDKRKMSFAIWSMLNRDHSKNKSRYKVNSHRYESIKKQVAEAISQLHKGKTVSKETREKLSKSCQGRPSPNKGKAMSEEQKQKMSATIKKNGRVISPETVAKILKSRKDYQHSEETKQKISNSNKGRIVIHTEETKKKLSDVAKGRSNTWLKGKSAHNRGIPHTKETVEKLKGPKSKYQCLHCNKLIGGKANYNRWHGDNCKTTFSIPASPV